MYITFSVCFVVYENVYVTSCTAAVRSIEILCIDMNKVELNYFLKHACFVVSYVRSLFAVKIQRNKKSGLLITDLVGLTLTS